MRFSVLFLLFSPFSFFAQSDSSFLRLKKAAEIEAIQNTDTATLVRLKKTISHDTIQYKYFESKGVSMDSATDIQLFFKSYEWAGTRYRYGAAVKQKGTDCSGFVCSVYRDVYCIDLPRSSSGIWPKTTAVQKQDLREGDVVFFKIKKGKISHVGIYLGNNKFIHAAVLGGVIINDLDEPYYKKYFYMGGRIEK
jgi:cell wall-associated NlpC family hydrolase